MIEALLHTVTYGPFWPFFIFGEPIEFGILMFGLVLAAVIYLPIILAGLGVQALPNQTGAGSKKVAMTLFVASAVFAVISVTTFVVESGEIAFIFIPHLLVGPMLFILGLIRRGSVRPSSRMWIIFGVVITYLTTLPVIAALFLS